MRGRTILVTGGSGTFGHAFVRYALQRGAARVVAMSRNAEMRYRLQQTYPDPRLIVVPGDVRMPSDLAHAFDVAGHTDILVHAAAEKHVSTGQLYQAYTYGVNVTGAEHVIEAAEAKHVRCVIALSTDKACVPVNYYGETKLMAEQRFIAAGRTVVRYGNVVGSSGSVLPLFLKQRQHGRLTITDRRMTRFFMPVSDDAAWGVVQEPGARGVMSAVALVAYAIEEGYGSEIFVPTIPSATIVNLAESLGPGCVLEETGIRDGEKLHEQLIAADEVPRTYRMPEGVYAIYSEPQAHLTPVEATFRHASDVDPQPIQVRFTEAQEAQLCESV
jgi:UDP-N-acetylglucosamine 4,6-dehydratase